MKSDVTICVNETESRPLRRLLTFRRMVWALALTVSCLAGATAGIDMGINNLDLSARNRGVSQRGLAEGDRSRVFHRAGASKIVPAGASVDFGVLFTGDVASTGRLTSAYAGADVSGFMDADRRQLWLRSAWPAKTDEARERISGLRYAKGR